MKRIERVPVVLPTLRLHPDRRDRRGPAPRKGRPSFAAHLDACRRELGKTALAEA
jgi:hypothetical protein